ncbi:MAG: hypothetical protein PHS30_04030 [Bacteroidales bacterium]|nr:hypothetical protein [Bacteroidales bacterium]
MERRNSSLNINSLIKNQKPTRQRPPQPKWDDEDIGVLNLEDEEEEEYDPEPEPKKRFKKRKQKPRYEDEGPRLINGLTIGQFIKEFLKLLGILIPFGLGIAYSLLQIFGNTPSVEQLRFLHVTQVLMFVMLLFVYFGCKR